MTIVSDNADTSRATTGDVITLTINASEDYTTAPTVVFTGATNADVVAVDDGDASLYTATYTVAQGDTNGVLAFTVTSTDASCNVSTNTSTTNSSAVTIDTDVPALSSVSIASNNNDTTLAKAADTVTLTFTADEAIGTPTVTFQSGDANIANNVTVSDL